MQIDVAQFLKLFRKTYEAHYDSHSNQYPHTTLWHIHSSYVTHIQRSMLFVFICRMTQILLYSAYQCKKLYMQKLLTMRFTIDMLIFRVLRIVEDSFYEKI